ncbi:kinase-like protein [Coniochaeta ligniaria NRRL 30616]|uniref:EKC/KEOPS complex subunit BUD32 n=1 Tax=Coniochaeta ligniaria NRRL 30616 TaxID=1408157 RepID=A0A1J7IXJ6_9PEZI|nr:kinase-like protein [Coniochaeta ligniaria NRRL 30616]
MTQQKAQRTLHNPFRGLEYHERGGYGHIFRLPDTAVVVKIPHRIVNGTAEDDARAAESLEILRRERTVYEVLATKAQHPNIVQYFLSTDSALFIKFEPETLEARLDRRDSNPVSKGRQFRWAQEIASAASWLESLDYFHGDLRPENVLLDTTEHVKLCDLGRAMKRGGKIEAATYPFYRPSKGAVAGPAHEQFAVGSCIYTIRTGEVPYGRWTTPADFKRMRDALIRGEYPQVEDDCILGHVVSSCWHSRYESMKDLEIAIRRAVGMLYQEDSVAASLPPEEYDAIVQTCRAFLTRQGQNDNKINEA